MGSKRTNCMNDPIIFIRLHLHMPDVQLTVSSWLTSNSCLWSFLDCCDKLRRYLGWGGEINNTHLMSEICKSFMVICDSDLWLMSLKSAFSERFLISLKWEMGSQRRWIKILFGPRIMIQGVKFKNRYERPDRMIVNYKPLPHMTT